MAWDAVYAFQNGIIERFGQLKTKENEHWSPNMTRNQMEQLIESRLNNEVELCQLSGTLPSVPISLAHEHGVTVAFYISLPIKDYFESKACVYWNSPISVMEIPSQCSLAFLELSDIRAGCLSASSQLWAADSEKMYSSLWKHFGPALPLGNCFFTGGYYWCLSNFSSLAPASPI